MRDQGNRCETGRVLHRRCDVEQVETLHRQEVGGLWRCVSCGYAEGEDLHRDYPLLGPHGLAR